MGKGIRAYPKIIISMNVVGAMPGCKDGMER